MESKDTDQSTPTVSGTLFATILKDPLSDVTRKERVYLLAFSTIGIAIATTGLIPSRISALGIQFDAANQNRLLSLLGAVIAYFLVVFIVYAVADFFAWFEDYRMVVREGKLLQDELNDKADVRRNAAYNSLNNGTDFPWTSHTQKFYDDLHEELMKDLRAHPIGRQAEEIGLLTHEQSYPDDAPAVMRKYIGEEPKRKKAKDRATAIAVVRGLLEYAVPVGWGIYAVLVLVV